MPLFREARINTAGSQVPWVAIPRHRPQLEDEQQRRRRKRRERSVENRAEISGYRYTRAEGTLPFVQQYIIRGSIASYRAGWMAFTIRDIVRHPYVATYCATRPPLSASGRDTLTRDVKICSKISPGRRQCISPTPSTYSRMPLRPRIIEQSSSNLKNVSSSRLAGASARGYIGSFRENFYTFPPSLPLLFSFTLSAMTLWLVLGCTDFTDAGRDLIDVASGVVRFLC